MLSRTPEYVRLPNDHPLRHKELEVHFFAESLSKYKASGVREVKAERQDTGYVLCTIELSGYIKSQVQYLSSKPEKIELSQPASITLFEPPAHRYVTAKAICNLFEWEREECRPNSKHYCLLDDEQILQEGNFEYYIWGEKKRKLTRLIPEGFAVENQEVDWGQAVG